MFFFFLSLAYLESIGVNTKFEKWSKTQLAEHLGEYYASQQGLVKTQTLINLRAGINRHLAAGNKFWNLTTDEEFNVANRVFKGVSRQNKKEGHSTVSPKRPLSTKEVAKIYENYFDPKFENDPVVLQHKLFFELVFFLGRRGLEGLQDMKKEDFAFYETDDGREYMQLIHHEVTKTSQGDDRNPWEQESIILAQPGSSRCPLKSFRFYVSKLSPDCEHLFQRPLKKKVDKTTAVWYQGERRGLHAIGQFLKLITIEAGISPPRTNHCLRATTISALSNGEEKFSDQDIANVTKHKDTKSIESYRKLSPFETQEKMCDKLFMFANNTKEHRRPQTIPCSVMLRDMHIDEGKNPRGGSASLSGSEEEGGKSQSSGGETNSEAGHGGETNSVEENMDTEHMNEELVVLRNSTMDFTSPTVSFPSPVEKEAIRTTKSGEPLGLIFGNAQLTNCTFHINVSN